MTHALTYSFFDIHYFNTLRYESAISTITLGINSNLLINVPSYFYCFRKQIIFAINYNTWILHLHNI